MQTRLHIRAQNCPGSCCVLSATAHWWQPSTASTDNCGDKCCCGLVTGINAWHVVRAIQTCVKATAPDVPAGVGHSIPPPTPGAAKDPRGGDTPRSTPHHPANLCSYFDPDHCCSQHQNEARSRPTRTPNGHLKRSDLPAWRATN